ncbi:MAG: cytochrome c3 family protein [Acidobacteriota bacterium]
MPAYKSKSLQRLKTAAVGALISFAAALVLCPDAIVETAQSQVRRVRRPSATAARPRKYSAFPHDVKAHRIDCASCHKFPSDNWNKVRAKDTAFPDIADYPKHESCLNCHRQQFFKGTPPVICSICHTTPGPSNSNRHPFPNPRELFDLSAKGKQAVSDFAISFPHDKHVDIVSQATPASSDVFVKASWRRAAAEESCSVCHKTMQPQGDSNDEYLTKPPAKLGDAFWLKKGTFKTVPTGHTTCFTCHSADSGMTPAPTDCATCHKLKPPMPAADFDAKLANTIGVTDKMMLDAWKRRDSSGTFRHEWASHAEQSCSACHNVNTINTADPVTKKVSITSCNMCHITATSDDGGALNFEIDSRNKDPKFQCTKCHIAFGSKSIPPSHVKAVEDAGK